MSLPPPGRGLRAGARADSRLEALVDERTVRGERCSAATQAEIDTERF
jgi:hypothetical protein